jgi:hypothetical protein
MTTAAPAASAAPASTTATPGVASGPEGEGTPGAEGQEAPAQATTARRLLKLRGLDGDDEREYAEEHVVGLAKRGLKSNQILSKAEQRAQEAAKKEAAAEEKLARLKS